MLTLGHWLGQTTSQVSAIFFCFKSAILNKSMADPRSGIIAYIYPEDVFPANLARKFFSMQDLPEAHRNAIYQFTTAIIQQERTWNLLAQILDGMPCEDSVVGNRLYHSALVGRRMPSVKAWDEVSTVVNALDYDELELDPTVCFLLLLLNPRGIYRR